MSRTDTLCNVSIQEVSLSTRSSLILPVYVPTLVMSLSQAMLIPTLPIFAKSFVESYGWVGLILGAEGLGRIVRCERDIARGRVP